MKGFAINDNGIIRDVGLNRNLNSNAMDIVNIKNRTDYEYAGFFIIDSDNQIQCISKQLCDLLGLVHIYKYLSGNVLTKLLYPGDALNIDYLLLKYAMTLNKDVKIELRFHSFFGLKKVQFSAIKILSDNALLVDLCCQKTFATNQL